MRLFPDGSIRPDTDPGDNTILLGQGHSGPILTWELPKDERADQELAISYEVVMNGYLAAFVEAHWGFVIGAVLQDVPSGQYKGIGHICGRVSGQPPCFQIEEWGLGASPPLPADFEYLRKGSQSPLVADGQRLKVYASRKRIANEFYSRLALRVLNPHGQYDVLHDTGDVQSNNWGVDRWRESLALFDTGYLQEPAPAYSIQIINLNAQQRAATCVVPDMRRAAA